MTIEERLTKNEERQKANLQRLQQLEQQKQELLQEMLRLDGEHRLLREMKAEKEKK